MREEIGGGVERGLQGIPGAKLVCSRQDEYQFQVKLGLKGLAILLTNRQMVMMVQTCVIALGRWSRTIKLRR